MDFKLRKGDQIRTLEATKASATVIEAGDLVALDGGLIIKAVDASTAVAYAPYGAGDGETTVEVSIGNDFDLIGTADAVFAASQKGTEVDIVVSDGAQLIDVGSSSNDVLKVDISTKAGTVGSAEEVAVKINKPLF